MTVQIVPREVLWAQSFMLAKGLNSLNAVPGIRLWEGEVSNTDIFNAWVMEFDSALSPSEDYQYYGSIEELSALRREDVGRSGLLLYRANIKLVAPALFSLALASLLLPSSLIAGELNVDPMYVDVAKGIPGAYELFAGRLPTVDEVRDSFKIVSKEDYPYVRSAVRLSCRNSFGFCLNPEAFSAKDLSLDLQNRAAKKQAGEEDAAAAAKRFVDDLTKALDAKQVALPCDSQSLQSALTSVLTAVSGLLNAGEYDWDARISAEGASVAACEKALRRLSSPECKMFSCTPGPGGSLEYRYINS